LAACGQGARGQQPVSVESRRFDIAFTVADDALPLDSAELWFRHGSEPQWRRYDADGDRQSPITFEAPEDGRFDLYLVLTNPTGPSSAQPSSATPPHLSVFVDATPPIVQLHDVRQSTSLGRRVLQIRWTAVDANLPVRPVEIMYQAPPGTTWHTATSEPVANTGRFDWPVPEDVDASVVVRIAVADMGGHHVSSEPVRVELIPDPEPVASSAVPPLDARVRLVSEPAASAVSGSRRAQELARKLLREALEDRDRGRFRDGVARLRDAVRLDPTLTEGFAELGSMLYALGDLDRALTAYDLALKQEPTLRSALSGAASIYAQKKNYNMAADRLRTILRHDPSDADMWLALGDVAVFQGDEMLARESYMRAAQVDPSAIGVVEEARKRLALMAQASRTYQSSGK
jgi:Flp pilus assembly protein TadD